MIYQLQQEAAEIRPNSVRLCCIGAGEADHIEEQALVDVKVLKIKSLSLLVGPSHWGGADIVFGDSVIQTGLNLRTRASVVV